MCNEIAKFPHGFWWILEFPVSTEAIEVFVGCHQHVLAIHIIFSGICLLGRNLQIVPQQQFHRALISISWMKRIRSFFESSSDEIDCEFVLPNQHHSVVDQLAVSGIVRYDETQVLSKFLSSVFCES